MTAAPPRLAVGKTVTTTERFEYTHHLTAVLWEVPAGSRMVLLRHKGGVWRVRVKELTFNLSAAMLARVTATEGK